MADMPEYEVYAIKYGDHNRMRSENFLFKDPHDEASSIDFFIWVIQGGGKTYVVDVGFESLGDRHGICPVRVPEEFGLVIMSKTVMGCAIEWWCTQEQIDESTRCDVLRLNQRQIHVAMNILNTFIATISTLRTFQAVSIKAIFLTYACSERAWLPRRTAS